jgi:putative GTP pyrophosphokinase
MKEHRIEEIPDRAALATLYDTHRTGYEITLAAVLSEVAETLRGAGVRPTLKSRVKEFDSYYEKKIRLLRKAWSESSPATPVNDILAIRAVCPFLGDLATAERALCTHFNVVEIERKGAERSFREFGYESIHLLVRIPATYAAECEGLERDVVEIQLRTILQEAWAEVEHELVYKAEFTPFDEPMKRKLAALNANLSLSDIIFQEILDYQKRLTRELARRRSAFYAKIEDVADSPQPSLLESRGLGPPDTKFEGIPVDDAASSANTFRRGGDDPGGTNSSGRAGTRGGAKANIADMDMDGLLLSALEAHNSEEYAVAVDLYGSILAQNPGREAAAVVHKHRGMAFFAQSRYHEAITDFGACLALDPGCYKAAYYRGVVKSVLGDDPGAVEDFTAALDIHPYHFYSRYRRALSWWRMGDPAQTLADCEAALRIEPKSELASRLREQARGRMNSSDF